MSSSNLQIINSDCIVIGGGITGLIIATVLQRKGIKVTVLDEKAIDGFTATRRISHEQSVEGVFDYGVQYFCVNNPKFQVWVDDWLKHEVVKEWCQGFKETDEQAVYCGIYGMASIAEYLTKDLNVAPNTEITEVSYNKKWLIKTQNDLQYQGDMLVMTSPIPETLSLLDASLMALPLEIRFALEKVEYDRAITVLALLEKPSSVPAPGGISIENYPLAWLGDNYQKGISPNGYAVTIHADSTFSDEYWSSDDAEIVYKLVTAAADYLDSPVIKYQVHRWNYLLPKTFYAEPYLGLLELPLVMAGSAFVAPTVEGEVMSGMAAGELIGKRFGVI